MRDFSESHIRFLYNVLRTRKFELVITNDIDTLPLALKLKGEGIARYVIFDAHEFYPEIYSNRLWLFVKGRYYESLCRTYISQADAMTVISSTMLEQYREFMDNKLPSNIFVLPNYAIYHDLKPTAVKPPVKLVHHGVGGRARKLHLLLDMMHYLPTNDYRLDMYIIPTQPSYLRTLQARKPSNVRILEPVPMTELIPTLNRYDIGISLLPLRGQYKTALPNKFFQYVQARLALIVSASTEMRAYIEQYGFGLYVETVEPQPSEIAKLISTLSPERIMAYKRRAHEYARTLSIDALKPSLLEFIDSLVAG